VNLYKGKQSISIKFLKYHRDLIKLQTKEQSKADKKATHLPRDATHLPKDADTNIKTKKKKIKKDKEEIQQEISQKTSEISQISEKIQTPKQKDIEEKTDGQKSTEIIKPKEKSRSKRTKKEIKFKRIATDSIDQIFENNYSLLPSKISLGK
jgi:hypothetical protein